MPRTERPLDAGSDVLVQFAAGLRRLREQAGSPPYRELARRAHYSAGTLSDAAGGRRLPGLSVALAYVRACEGDVAEWEQRWHCVATDLAADAENNRGDTPDGDTPQAPYVGLAAFQAGDADRFHGREKLTEDLVRRVGEQRFLAVFGASGAGKSSLLRAGLVARLRRPTADGRPPGPVAVFTPGAHPLEECAVAVAGFTDQAPISLRAELRADPEALHLRIRQAMAERTGDAVLVVDQFEEIFTVCTDPDEREGFIAALTAAARATGSRTRIVLGVRTDFYTHCAAHPALVTALRDAQLLVGPMTMDELRAAVTRPALQAGYSIEGALLATVVAEAVGQPGVLPLVSHALLETWRRRRGTALTVAGYQAAGGITHAVAHTAEAVYGELDEAQRRVARDLFLRLTAFGEGTEDTGRRIRRHELDTGDRNVDVVLERHVQARLVTVDGDAIQITHEALIRCWPRLHGWLAEDRDGLRAHRQLTEAAQAWESLARDQDALYRGGRLATARDWAATTDAALNPTERAFLAASATAESDERAVTRRRARRLRQLVALLGVLLVVATAATAYAVRAQRTATQQRDIAEAQNVLSQAVGLHDSDPALALQLSLAAYRLGPTEQTRSGVLNILNTPYVRRLPEFTDGVNSVAFNPDGRTLATAANLTVGIWGVTDTGRPTIVGTLGAFADAVSAVAYSPADGRILVTVDLNGAKLWNVADVRHPVVLADLPGPVDSAAFDRGGHLLATVGTDGGVELWDVTDLRRPAALAALPGPRVSGVAFSADRRTLAELVGVGPGTEIDLWDVSDPGHPVAVGAVTAATGMFTTMSFAPAGAVLAVGVDNGTTQLWDLTVARRPSAITTLVGQTGTVSATAFSAEGNTLASATSDGSIWVWNVDTPGDPRQVAALAGHTGGGTGAAVDPSGLVGGVATIAFGAGGHSLATASINGTVQLVDLPQFALTSSSGGAVSAGFSPDGRTLATAVPLPGQADGTTRLWDLTDVGRPVPAANLGGAALRAGMPGGDAGVGYAVAFGPGRGLLATAGPMNSRLWDVTDPRNPVTLSVLDGTAGPIALSPNGRVLAGIGSLGNVELRDVTDPRRPRLLATLDPIAGSLVFSPDGRILAAVGRDGRVWLCDVTAPDRPAMIAHIPADVRASLAFSPDGHTLAIGETGGAIQLVGVADPGHPATLATLPGSPTVSNTVAFSPDGRTLATSGANDTTRLWGVGDPTRPDLQAVLTGTRHPVAFDPDGHTLAVIGQDGAVQLRETDVGRAAARVCALTGANLDRAAWDQYFPGLAYQPPCP